VLIEDVEGAPVATITGAELVATRPHAHAPLVRPLAAGHAATTGTGPRRLIAVVGGPLSSDQISQARARAWRERAGLTWLVLVGAGRSHVLPATTVHRIMRRLSSRDERVVALPVPTLADPTAEARIVADVAARFGADDVLTFPAVDLDDAHLAFSDEAERLRRAGASRRGLTVFFTGLSGSGKSTLARRLAERLTTDAERTVTPLDGDEVRRLLSAGLGFSPADIDLNLDRIAFVATEVTRHGGVAVCAPIAPFAAARARARAAVEEVGDFVLVHVATPLAECERRDRKGLYARARAGEIPDFVGISTPYEPPTDADLVLDTTGQQIEECVAAIWELVGSRGHLTTAIARERP
jgi:sulfate adenylyltransferase